MQDWSSFDRIEAEHYGAMFADYNREWDQEQADIPSWEKPTLAVSWDSESDECCDCEIVFAMNEDEALEVFWGECERNKIPDDAVVTEVAQI